MSLFRKKDLSAMLAQADDGGKGLKRTLGAGNLIALGVGAIIGAGLFVRTAAAAGQAAGPAVTLSFIVAAIGCAFAGLCYAQFAAMIPISCLFLRNNGRNGSLDYWLGLDHGICIRCSNSFYCLE